MGMLSLPTTRAATVVSWLVGIGDTFTAGEVVGNYREHGAHADAVLTAKCDGRVARLLAAEGDSVDAGGDVLEYECAHAIVLHGLCAECGIDLSNEIAAQQSQFGQHAPQHFSMVHGMPGLVVEKHEAHRIAGHDEKRLREARKLTLIVDLDQTLIHATTQCAPWMIDKLAAQPAEGLKDMVSFVLPGSPIVYYVKVRPHTAEFLASLAPKFEMHIFTMGTRPYAREVAAVIDPTGAYFAGRILSREDLGGISDSKTSRLQHLFPTGDSMVVIVDDRADVWEACPNLVKIRPYVYFMGAADVNALPKDAAKAKGDGEAQAHPAVAPSDDDDDHLLSVRDFVAHVHEAFYAEEGVETVADADPDARDVRQIVPALEARALEGVSIVFSGVIPLHETRPERHPIWLRAVGMGATCSNALHGGATHVVAAKSGTDKVNAAVACGGMYIVHVGWLTASIDRHCRADEHAHPLEGVPVLPARRLLSDDSDEDDDEEFGVVGDGDEGDGMESGEGDAEGAYEMGAAEGEGGGDSSSVSGEGGGDAGHPGANKRKRDVDDDMGPSDVSEGKEGERGVADDIDFGGSDETSDSSSSDSDEGDDDDLLS